MFLSTFLRRLSSALSRLRDRPDRTRTTDYALQSNATAIENLTRAIEKKRLPPQRRKTAIEQCLKASFGSEPEVEASQALKTAIERLRRASEKDGS